MRGKSKMATEAVPLSTGQAKDKPYNPWREILRRLLHNRSAQIGLIILAFLLVVSIGAPVIATHNPIDYTDPDNKTRLTPCIHLLGCPADQREYLFGLDGNGRDLFSRIVYAAQTSLFIGVTTVIFGVVVGTVIGALSGFLGGWFDNSAMRLMDVLLAFPSLLLAIALVAVLRPIIIQVCLSPLLPALFAIGFVSIPIYARI